MVENLNPFLITKKIDNSIARILRIILGFESFENAILNKEFAYLTVS